VSNVEDTNNSSDLSEFFSALSEEKKESRQKLEAEIANPESGLSNLFQQLEEVHRETQKVSEEIPDNKSLSPDDHNKLEAFSSLMSSVDVSLQEAQEETPEVIETVEPVVAEVFNSNSEKETDKLEAFSKLFGELAKVEEKQEPQKELVIEGEVSDAVSALSGKLNLIPQDINELTKPQIVAQETNNIIADVISNLDDMETKTEVKEEVDQITSIRTEFEKFKTHIQQHISNQGFSGGGSGETRVEFLDDVDRDTAKVNGKALVYDSSSGKWKGETVLTGAITGLDIDGGTDIGAALADADLFIVDDGAGGTNRKATLSRLKTYIGAGAADDLGAGDAAVTLTTSSGNITIDAAANDSDIIFKGTDGGADITMLTLDGSADGAAIFKSTVTATGFAGALTGNVTGNASGTAATVTGAAQTNITSLGTLTALTVDNIVINGANIGHTSDTDALAIDSSGNVTASQNLIVSGDFTVNGTTTTISSTNTVVADNLFELNNGAGSNSNDSGIIIERGSTGDNAIIMWDESADKFQIGTTTATASATGNISVTSGILVASSFEGNLTSTAIENSGQTTSDSFNLPITLNGTNGSSANGGDNIVQNTSADENDRLVYEDATPTHYERPITWDRTT